MQKHKDMREPAHHENLGKKQLSKVLPGTRSSRCSGDAAILVSSNESTVQVILIQRGADEADPETQSASTEMQVTPASPAWGTWMSQQPAEHMKGIIFSSASLRLVCSLGLSKKSQHRENYSRGQFDSRNLFSSGYNAASSKNKQYETPSWPEGTRLASKELSSSPEGGILEPLAGLPTFLALCPSTVASVLSLCISAGPQICSIKIY